MNTEHGDGVARQGCKQILIHVEMCWQAPLRGHWTQGDVDV